MAFLNGATLAHPDLKPASVGWVKRSETRHYRNRLVLEQENVPLPIRQVLWIAVHLVGTSDSEYQFMTGTVT